MNGLNGKGNGCNNSPQYSSPAAILENTDTKMQRDLIAHTACRQRDLTIKSVFENVVRPPF